MQMSLKLKVLMALLCCILAAAIWLAMPAALK
jgi:hypothetical protein